jgi:pentatricopeptide repeat protein
MKPSERDLLLWNSMIFSFGQVGNGIQALHIFERMQSEGMAPNEKTIAYILIACCTSGLIENAIEILFSAEMKFNIKPNARHYNIVLSSCTNAKLYHIGKKVHAHLVNNHCPQNIILKNSLLNMYGKSGDIREASTIFNSIDIAERCIVTWSTMIKAYHTCKMYKEVLELFEKMQQSAVQPNETVITDVLSAYCCVTLLNEALEMLYSMKTKFGVKPNAIHYSFFLDACASNAFFDMGKLAKEHMSQNKCENSVGLICSLINFYSKCGFLEESLHIFNSIDISERNDVVWNAMIEAYGENGKGEEALSMLEEMKENELAISEKTMASILNACGRAGLIEELFEIFAKMEKKFNIKPNLKHCNIVIDTLCRIGRLEEAEAFLSRYVKREQIEPDINTFISLLIACKKKLDLERAGQIAKLLIHTNQDDPLAYMLLLSIYTKTGDTIKEKALREIMETKGIKEIPDVSIIEINGKLYQFTNEDKSNLDIKAIESELEVLNHEVMKARCGNDIDWEIQGVLVEKEKRMCLHSEKLAISYAMINTAPNTTIRISKNVRVHDDCHDDIKLISKIRKRDIIIKDSFGFHRFKDGICSCNDHW